MVRRIWGSLGQNADQEGLLMQGAGASPEPLHHAAFLYRTPAEFTTVVLDFIEAGVSADEAVLVAAAGPHLQQLRARLNGLGKLLAWADTVGTGTNPRGMTAAIRSFADEHRGQPVRCVQEPAWYSRSGDELREAIRHEALVNLVLAGRPVTMLCAYDLRRDTGTLGCVERTHPMVIQEGRWRPSGSYAGQAVIPAECDVPLSPPPRGAAVLPYRHDQAAVRRVAAEHAQQAGLSPDRVGDLVIAVGELTGNTLAHTPGPGTLTIWVTSGEIICQVEDTGQISDPLVGTRRPDPAAYERGAGLWVVNQLCDLVQMRTGPGGSTFRVHMRLKA
jgi:anti-sigma regulatory factor (Ser/Thr protein kinase)